MIDVNSLSEQSMNNYLISSIVYIVWSTANVIRMKYKLCTLSSLYYAIYIKLQLNINNKINVCLNEK